MTRAKVTVRLDRDLLDRVEGIAKRKRLPVDDVVAQALVEAADADDFFEESKVQVTADKRERKKLRARYESLFDDMAAMLFEVDPAGINDETNTNEYEPEVGTVLPRLREATNEDDVRRILLEEFDRWFDHGGYDVEKTGIVATRLWALWREWVANRSA